MNDRLKTYILVYFNESLGDKLVHDRRCKDIKYKDVGWVPSDKGRLLKYTHWMGQHPRHLIRGDWVSESTLSSI